MTQEQDNLLRECHAMLTEIVGYIRRIQSKEYIDEDTVKQFAINLAANVLVDGMEESQKQSFIEPFKSK